MTLTRVYVRRNFARPPLCLQLPANFELDWFAMSLMDKDPAIWLHGSNHTTKSTETNSFDDKEPENGSDCPTSIPSLRVITANVSESGGLKSQMPSEQSRAHQLVLIRNQLGDLAGWRSVVHPDARILKRAIDITLEALADYYPRGTWIWGFETEFNGEGSQEVHFEVTGSKIGLTAGLLEAVLSLWVYSIDQQRRDFRQRHFADAYLPWARGADDGEDGTGDEWYNVDFRHSEQHLRSLGYTSRQLQRDLHWWVPLGGESFNAIWVESVGTPRGDSRVCDRTRAGGSGLDIPWLDEEGHAEVPIIFYASPSESKGPVFDVNDANSQANGLISSRVSGTPKSFYAQELFSSFMWTLAKTMTVRIGGTTDVQLSAVPSDNPLESFTLSNKILSALINDIHNTGLASLETTFSLVIPPLSAVNKLPDATAVIELARHEANPYEQRGNLFEAGKIYVWLARAMRTFPSESEVRAKAIAVFVQHAKHVQEVMDYWRRCVGLHDAMSFVALQTHQEMIREELKGDEIREALMELYDYRNHLTKSEGIAWSQGAPEEKLPSTLGFTKTHAFAKQPRAPYDLSSHLSHINLPDVFGRTPIHYAATTAESSIMQVVRNIKGLVDVADLGGKTPLHYACEAAGAGTDKIVRSLIEAGAELDRQARDGTRPIHCAAASGAEKTLRILAEAGATVDVLDATGKSPLMLAALGGHHGAVEYLSLISNQSLRDAHGRNVLHMAVASGNLEVVRLFAEEKHYSHDRNGHTPLNIAAYVGDADMVRFLIGKFNTKDEFVSPKTSLTPLHSAISAGQADIVNMLIREYDVDKNTADGAGWLPLHCAAWAGRYDMVRLLIEEYSANKEVKTRLDWTPLFVAIEMDRGLELVRPLIEEFGCDVNTRDRQQQTLLHVAARRKDTGLARYFLEKQCIDVDARDENGRTPLFTAVRMQHEDMARMLVLEFGADVNARDTQGKTPLHNAMESRNDPSSIAEALLRELGADMHALDEKDTPLHVPNSI